MLDATFETLNPAVAKKFLAEIAPAIAPVTVSETNTTVSVASVPFYDEVKLYVLKDTTMPEPNERYVLHKTGSTTLLNWTNEPIYSVNEAAQSSSTARASSLTPSSFSIMCVVSWAVSSLLKSRRKSPGSTAPPTKKKPMSPNN